MERVIVSDREISGGTPVFRNTRVPFRTLLDYLQKDTILTIFRLSLGKMQLLP